MTRNIHQINERKDKIRIAYSFNVLEQHDHQWYNTVKKTYRLQKK